MNKEKKKASAMELRIVAVVVVPIIVMAGLRLTQELQETSERVQAELAVRLGRAQAAEMEACKQATKGRTDYIPRWVEPDLPWESSRFTCASASDGHEVVPQSLPSCNSRQLDQCGGS